MHMRFLYQALAAHPLVQVTAYVINDTVTVLILRILL